MIRRIVGARRFLLVLFLVTVVGPGLVLGAKQPVGQAFEPVRAADWKVCPTFAPGAGLVLTSPSASSNYRSLSVPSIYLPLVLKAWDPENMPPTNTPTPTATATHTATPTVTPTPTATPVGAVVVISSSAFTETVGARTMIYVVGEVGNAVSSSLESVTVAATFYDASGVPVASVQALAYQPLLGPGQASPFKIEADRPSSYTHYRLQVTYAFSTQPPPVELPVIHTSSFDDELSDWRYLFGEVQNTTGSTISQMMVIGTFYDEAGKVLNVKAGSPFYEDLEPGETSPFRLVLDLGPTTYAGQSWAVVYAPVPGPAYHGLPLLSRSHVRDSWEVEGENGSVIVLQSLNIFGEFQNNTDGPVYKARVIGAFYDKAGNVINASATHYPVGLRHILAPLERAPFHLRLDTGPIPQDGDRWVFDVLYEPAMSQSPPRIPILSSTIYHEQHAEQQGDETVLVRWVDIVGEIGNETNASLKSARVIGTFYDDQGVVVNVAAASAYRRIVPTGERSPFRLPISFGPLEWATSSLTVDYTASSETPIGALDIVNDRAEQGGALVILGELRNSGTQTVQAPQVMATLYDDAEAVINVKRLRLEDPLDSGETVPFALDFTTHFDGWAGYELYGEGTY